MLVQPPMVEITEAELQALVDDCTPEHHRSPQRPGFGWGIFVSIDRCC